MLFLSIIKYVLVLIRYKLFENQIQLSKSTTIILKLKKNATVVGCVGPQSYDWTW